MMKCCAGSAALDARISQVADMVLQLPAPSQRSLRLFVLKQLDRALGFQSWRLLSFTHLLFFSGMTSTRQILKRLYSSNVGWTKQWIDSEAQIARFATGSECIPSDDPFHYDVLWIFFRLCFITLMCRS